MMQKPSRKKNKVNHNHFHVIVVGGLIDSLNWFVCVDIWQFWEHWSQSWSFFCKKEANGKQSKLSWC